MTEDGVCGIVVVGCGGGGVGVVSWRTITAAIVVASTAAVKTHIDFFMAVPLFGLSYSCFERLHCSECCSRAADPEDTIWIGKWSW
jgi:hypothetical protein